MIRALRILAGFQFLILLLAALVMFAALNGQRAVTFNDMIVLALALITPTLTGLMAVAVALILEKMDWLVAMVNEGSSQAPDQ